LPKALCKDGRIVPYAYPQAVPEAESGPRREHHAAFF
jgi:hypothetical protein